MPRPRPDFQVEVPIFRGWVSVFTDTDRAAAWMRRHKEESAAKATEGKNPQLDGGAFVVILDDPGYWVLCIAPDADADVLAHECIHLAWFVLERAGVHLYASNHEPLAYLVQHLMREIRTGLSRQPNTRL